jgi:hypothetical protein
MFLSGLPVQAGSVALTGLCGVATFATPLAADAVANYTVVVSGVQSGAAQQTAVAVYTTDFTTLGVTVCAKPFELLYDADAEPPAMNVSYVLMPIAANSMVATGSVQRPAEVFSAVLPSCFTVPVAATPRAVFTSIHYASVDGVVRARSAAGRPTRPLTLCPCTRAVNGPSLDGLPDVDQQLHLDVLPRVRGHEWLRNGTAGGSLRGQLHCLPHGAHGRQRHRQWRAAGARAVAAARRVRYTPVQQRQLAAVADQHDQRGGSVGPQRHDDHCLRGRVDLVL